VVYAWPLAAALESLPMCKFGFRALALNESLQSGLVGTRQPREAAVDRTGWPLLVERWCMRALSRSISACSCATSRALSLAYELALFSAPDRYASCCRRSALTAAREAIQASHARRPARSWAARSTSAGSGSAGSRQTGCRRVEAADLGWRRQRGPPPR